MKKLIFILTFCLPMQTLHAGDVETDSLSVKLQEIVVAANQPATRLVGTALVSTITGSNLQHIGTASDLLAQLPMIEVTGDEISVTGRGIPDIYIDGRPMRSPEELIQLQSDNIKKVELEMSPGAMYASDVKAVLKIYTRRDFINGLSFTDRGQVAATRRWSASNVVDLNYRRGEWEIFASGLIARNNSLIKGITENTLIHDGKKTVIGSSQHKEYPTTTGVVKGGFNCSSDAGSFGAYYRYNPERGHFNNFGSEWMNDDTPVDRNIHADIKGATHRGSAYYDNTFAGRYLLHFDGDYRYSSSSTDRQTLYPGGNVSEVSSSETRKSTLWAGKLYLSFPLAAGSFTVGTQDSYTRSTLDYTMLNDEVGQYIPSSATDVSQTSAAFFATWKRMFSNLSISAGLRYEYVDFIYNLNGVRDKDMSRTDNYLTPDISIGYSFNHESQLSLSYRMSTLKPPYSHLTSGLSYVGIHEIEGGNQALKDERMHDVQLFGMWKGFMLQADFTRSIDSYAFVKRVYPAESLQLLMQPVNINLSAFDLFLVWSHQVKSWEPNITVGLHKQWLAIDGHDYNRPIFSYYFDNMFMLPKGFTVTLNASGQSKGDMHTNRFGTTIFTLNASVGKSFLNNALQLKLSANDIFNTRNNDWTMNTCGVFVDKRQTYDHRGVFLSLTYRFQPRKSGYKGEDAAKSEMKRL